MSGLGTTGAREAARQRVADFITALDTEVDDRGPNAWAIRLEAAGHPLDLAVTIRGGLLAIEAAVLPPGLIDPHQLLYWNGQAPFVCFAENRDGEVLISGELPLEQLSSETLDRFLGLALASATRARQFVLTGS